MFKQAYRAIGRAVQTALCITIQLYRVTLSPLLGNRCCYYPSCSVYCQQAIRVYGVWRGLWLGIRRIARCHPGRDAGVDELPLPAQSSLDAGHPPTSKQSLNTDLQN